MAFRLFYSALAFAGAVISPKIVWTLADIFNGIMAIPNLFAINCLRDEVEFPKKEKAQKHCEVSKIALSQI